MDTSPEPHPSPVDGVGARNKAFLEVFATTGHESLRALLLISAGSVVTFLAFLGTVLSNRDVANSFGQEAIARFLCALIAFILSVVFCLLCYGASFGSHAYFYHRKDSQGRKMTVVAGGFWLLSIVCLIVGGYFGVSGLRAANVDKPAAAKTELRPLDISFTSESSRLGIVNVLGVTHAPQSRSSEPQTTERETRVALLRARAKEHIDQERALYSVFELEDIESRYRSAHHTVPLKLLRRDASPVLRELVARYPRSHRSGCAVLDLAQLASGDEREHHLKEAIANYSDAWCESGVQVGALARARLAIHYGQLHRFDEAERLCEELSALFPGAIDPSGAPLEDVVKGIKLLRG